MRLQGIHWWLLFISVGLLGLLGPHPLWAQELRGTRPLGMGHAYRSVAAGNEAIYYNPAALTAIPRYSPEVQYQFNLDRSLHDVDVTVVDSITNALGVGLGYTFSNREPGNEAVRGHRATAAVAYPIVPGTFHFGAGFKYLNISHALAGTFVNALTADTGLLLTPGLGLSFALVGYNVIPITTSEAPMNMAVAGSWSIEGLTLAFDWTLDFESSWPPGMSYHGGAEYYLMEMFPLRVGYENDQVSGKSAVTFGAGFVLGWFALDLGFQQQLERFDDRTFGVALKFFLFTPPPPSATPGSYRPMAPPQMPGWPQAQSITE